MLNWLKIKNMALIEALDVEFDEGFNVITGETGAGKSILLGTIALLLGGRADKGVIRSGTERCELAAGITLRKDAQNALLSALEQADIPIEDESNEIQLRRVIGKTSNRNYINDTPVTLQTLKNIGNFLVDIHAANEHQSLLNRGTQLDILDRFGKLDQLTGECRDLCRELNALRSEREKTFADMPSSIEAEHLKMIVEEIEKISPEPDEDEKLNVKHSLAANSKTILELSSRAVMSLCDSEESIVDKLGEVYRDIQELAHIDSEKAEPLLTACDQIVEQVRDLSYEIENYGSNIELDEQGFRELENRLTDLQTLKRRYGPSLERVLLECEKAQERLLVYSDAEKLRQEFQKKEDDLFAKLKNRRSKTFKGTEESGKGFLSSSGSKIESAGLFTV